MLGPWRWSYLAHEMVLSAGLLYPLGLVVLGLTARARGLRALLDPLPLALLALVLSFLPFGFTAAIEERGAYFLVLVPPLALAASSLAARWTRAGTLVLLAVVWLQLAAARREVDAWEHGYPGRDWAEALALETGDRGVLLAASRDEAMAVACHFEISAFAPGQRVLLGEETDDAGLLRLLDKALRRGEPVALTRTLLEARDPEVRHFVEAVLRRHGPLRPGADPRYLFLAGGRGLDAEPEQPPSAGTGSG